MNRFEAGQKIDTQVVAISNDTVFINLGLKSEGFVDKAEFTDENGNVSVKEGDKISVYFLSSKGDELHFTTKLSGDKASSEMLESAYRNGLPVEGHVEKEIKGGFEVIIGSSRAFCPYSQMGYKNREEAANYVGKHLTFVVQEYKNEGRNIIVSNRAVMEAEEKKHFSDLSKKLTVGTVVKGEVISLQNYGAFVNLDGFQALLPISEVSHQRIEDLSTILTVGQEIEAKIIKADWEHERVSLSMKALEKDPWDEVTSKYSEGSKIDGKIARVAEYGIFVNLEPGIDGLVHVSELDVDKNTNLHKVFNVGDKYSVVVKEIDSESHRISLRPATSVEQDKTAETYLKNQDNDDTYNPFAAFFKNKK
ncbi:MAG: S1 RNA-binding domain-containing protein [Treponema sp.]|nr:S1 RNA-binding domain-containing protein [Treponema sp.]